MEEKKEETEKPPEKLIEDTLYSFDEKNENGSTQIKKEVRDYHTELELEKTTPTERRRKSQIKKKGAKMALKGLQNKDAFFALIDRLCFLATAEMTRRGGFLSALLWGLAFIFFCGLKNIAEKGPLFSLISKPEKIKEKLVDISRTIYHR